MAAFTELKEALYNIFSRMFPNTQVIHMYDGGVEPSNPYIGIYILAFNQVGREETTSYASETSLNSNVYQLSTKVTYEASVQISCRGSTAGDLAHAVNQDLNIPTTWQILRENNLSKMRVSNVRSAPQLRETKWIQAYNQDITFAYCYVSDTPIDVIEQVIIVDTQTGDTYKIPENIG